MSCGIKGTVYEVSDMETIKGRNGTDYSKKSIVVEYGDQYKRCVEVEFFGNEEKFPRELADVAEGQEVTVRANPTSRYSDKHSRWFTKFEGWYLKVHGDAPASQEPREIPAGVDEIPF